MSTPSRETTPNQADADKAAERVTVIRPTPGWSAINLAECWQYRDLLWIFTLRDISVRYKQTLVGVGWAVLQPLMTMLIFSIFFGALAKIPSDGAPYPLFAFAALLPWQLFAHALTYSSNSVLENERLITKVYFPRLIIPFASVGAGLADFLVSILVFFAMMAWYGVRPGPAILLLPLFTLFAVIVAISVGLWLAALSSMYRDFRYTIAFIIQCWMFASPVVYSTNMVSEKWRWFYSLNPMVGVIDGFRWSLLGIGRPPGIALAVSVLATLAILVGGLFYFKRIERTFADRI